MGVPGFRVQGSAFRLWNAPWTEALADIAVAVKMSWRQGCRSLSNVVALIVKPMVGVPYYKHSTMGPKTLFELLRPLYYIRLLCAFLAEGVFEQQGFGLRGFRALASIG